MILQYHIPELLHFWFEDYQFVNCSYVHNKCLLTKFYLSGFNFYNFWIFFIIVILYYNMSLCVHPQSCLGLCDPMDCSLPGSSVHGIFQARILEWVAISSSKGSS